MSTTKFHKYIFLFLSAAALLTQVACKKTNSGAAPQIAQIRAISPSPNDSVLTTALPGQIVVVQGTNLGAAYKVSFNGFPATLNTALFADGNLVVTIPAIAWDSIPSGKLDLVEVTTPAGTASYTFHITAPAPTITSLSNEMATAGTSLTIYGNNFYAISKVVFPGGIEVSNPTVSGITQITLTVPPGITSGGPIEVVGAFGTGTSILLFNDMATGMICNFDDVNTYVWGVTEISSNATAYPGNRGSYAHMVASGINGGDWAWYDGKRSINVGGGSSQWIPAGHMGDALDSYALKFEVNIQKQNEWGAGKFFIVKDYDWTYLAQWVPWTADSKFSTDGWQTITIPLSQFKKDNGTGASASSLATLVGSGSGGLDVMFINDGTTTAAIDAAFDNFRIEKIK